MLYEVITVMQVVAEIGQLFLAPVHRHIGLGLEHDLVIRISYNFV